MKKVKIKSVTAINNKEKKTFINAAYTDEYVYLIDGCSKNVYAYNHDFKNYTIFNTKRIYSSICFDFNNKEILAASPTNYNIIYVLNLQIQEENRIILKYDLDKETIISSIYYNTTRGTGTIIVTTNNEILEIDREGNILRKFNKQKPNSQIDFAAIVSSLLVGISIHNNYIDILNNEIPLFHHIKPPNHLFFLAIINIHYSKKTNEILLNVLTKHKNGSNYILCITAYQYDSNNDIPGPDELHSKPRVEEKCEKIPPNDNKPHPLPPLNPLIDNYLNALSHDINSKYTLIESIALIEVSLSHILNSEGEKLQKAVIISNNIDDLILINKSINETIKNVTDLEKILYAKLKAVTTVK